jgi:hypothetical protein
VSDERREILLDGTRWQSRDDVYSALFAALGSPGWHGRNFNALRDSIGVGGINRVETPYRLRVAGLEGMSADARSFVADFSDLIRELQAEGVEVSISCAS